MLRHPSHPQRAVVVRGQVFVGGYFYDPSFTSKIEVGDAQTVPLNMSLMTTSF